jgi:hypothetical protein
MLLVGCLGTAVCWNGRLLTLGGTSWHFFFQLTVTITQNVLPHCTASIRKAFSSGWEQTNTFPHYVTVKCGKILLSSVVVVSTERHTKYAATCSLTPVPARVKLVLMHRNMHCVIHVDVIQMIIHANVFRRWEQCVHVTSTAHLNAGHPWTVQTAAMEWEPSRYRTIIGTVPTECSQSTAWSVASVPHYLQRALLFSDSRPLQTQSCESLQCLTHSRQAHFT